MSLDTVIFLEIGLMQPISDEDLHIHLSRLKKSRPYGLNKLNFKQNGTLPYSDYVDRAILRGVACGILGRDEDGKLLKLVETERLKECMGEMIMKAENETEANLTAQSYLYDKLQEFLFELGIEAEINYDDGMSSSLIIEMSQNGVNKAVELWNGS